MNEEQKNVKIEDVEELESKCAPDWWEWLAEITSSPFERKPVVVERNIIAMLSALEGE